MYLVKNLKKLGKPYSCDLFWPKRQEVCFLAAFEKGFLALKRHKEKAFLFLRVTPETVQPTQVPEGSQSGDKAEVITMFNQNKEPE